MTAQHPESGGPDGPAWSPDARTLTWCFGAAHEDRVKDAIRADVADRAAHLSTDADPYWTIVAEAAIEAILFDLRRQAVEWGTEFPGRAAGPE